MSKAAGRLVVTLRRGLAGKRASEVSAALALRLRKTGQSAEHPNTESVRGQISKARPRPAQRATACGVSRRFACAGLRCAPAVARAWCLRLRCAGPHRLRVHRPSPPALRRAPASPQP